MTVDESGNETVTTDETTENTGYPVYVMETYTEARYLPNNEDRFVEIPDSGYYVANIPQSCKVVISYKPGVSLLGAHIKYGRVYTDERTIRSFRRSIRKWNRLAYPSMTEHFLSSVNSYLGILKHRNDYGKIRDLVEEVSPKWLKYCHYNDDRRCFVANEGYGHNDVLVRKYGFRFNKSKHRHHDKTGNRRHQEQARLAHFGS